jgi:hypothetical protein
LTLSTRSPAYLREPGEAGSKEQLRKAFTVYSRQQKKHCCLLLFCIKIKTSESRKKEMPA